MTHAFNDPAAARFAFDNTYSRELEGFYVPWKAAHYAPFETLLNILSRPLDDQPEFAAFAEPAPERPGYYRTFCGT
jgi:hypothetical protein